MIHIFNDIKQIYNYYDRPLTFICEDDSKKYFVFWYDFEEDIDKWLVIPISDDEIRKLNRAGIGLKEFILKAEHINCLIYNIDEYINKEEMTAEKLLTEYLPSAEMYIYNGRVYNVLRNMNAELLYKLLMQKYKNYETSQCEFIEENDFVFKLYNTNDRILLINYYVKDKDSIENVNLRWSRNPYFEYIYFLREARYENIKQDYKKLVFNVIVECEEPEIDRIQEVMEISERISRIRKYWSKKLEIEISIEYESIYTLFKENMHRISE